MNRLQDGVINYYGYKNINEMVTAECTPLLDILLKLSSAGANFANAANNVKNVSISDKNEIKDLLDLVFDISSLSSKVEKLIEQRIEYNLKVISSGIFEEQHMKHVKEESISEALNIGRIIGKEIKE